MKKVITLNKLNILHVSNLFHWLINVQCQYLWCQLLQLGMTRSISLTAMDVVSSAISRIGQCTWLKWSVSQFWIQLDPTGPCKIHSTTFFLGGGLGFLAGVKSLTDLASHLSYFSATAALDGLFPEILGAWICFVQPPGTTTGSTLNAFNLSLTESEIRQRKLTQLSSLRPNARRPTTESIHSSVKPHVTLLSFFIYPQQTLIF